MEVDMFHQRAPLAFAVNSLVDIHDAELRDPGEAACFAELQGVLRKFGLEKKYGVTLLHKHFDLAADEILVEHTDIENRTLVSRPEKVASIPDQNLIEVTWSLDSDEVMGVCSGRCFYNQN